MDIAGGGNILQVSGKYKDINEAVFKPSIEVSKEIENRIYAKKMKSIKAAWIKKLKDKAFIEVLD